MSFKNENVKYIYLWLVFTYVNFHEIEATSENNDIVLLTEKPHWLKMCRRSDPELNNCLKDLFDKMFPELATGIPEIDVKPFEPLYLDEVSISKGTGAVTLTGCLSNLTVSGPSKAIPVYSNMNITARKFSFGIDLPLLNINAVYNLKGKILVLPLVGHGAADMILDNVHTHVKTNFSFPIVQNREIFKVDHMQVEFSLDSMKVKFENLFNGNKVLGNTVNNFLNQNSLEIIGELSDSISESLAEIFTNLMNNIFSKIPTDLWLPQEQAKEVNAQK